MRSQDVYPDFKEREKAIRKLRRELGADFRTRSLKPSLKKLADSESLSASLRVQSIKKIVVEENIDFKELPSIVLSIIFFDFLIPLISRDSAEYIFIHWDEKLDVNIDETNFFDFILDSASFSAFVHNIAKLYTNDIKLKKPIGAFELIIVVREYLETFLQTHAQEGRNTSKVYTQILEMIQPLEGFIREFIEVSINKDNEG